MGIATEQRPASNGIGLSFGLYHPGHGIGIEIYPTDGTYHLLLFIDMYRIDYCISTPDAMKTIVHRAIEN
jgi:hypothetical protein